MASDEAPALAPYPGRKTAYYALAVLLTASFFSFLDRQLLNLLSPPIKADLGISDTQLGLLQGLAFALLFSLLAMPFGWLADRTNRRNLAAAGAGVWCVATLCSGFCDSFLQLAIARAGVGIGEATLMPVAFSLLSDLFPPHQRGRAFAVFSMGNLLGGGSAMLVGGMVLRALGGLSEVSLPLIGVLPVWKAAFIVVGLPGLVLIPLLLSTPEPARRRDHAQAGGGGHPDKLVQYVARQPAAFFYVWGLYSLLALLSYSVTPWVPTLLVRQHAMPLNVAGLTAGAMYLVAGLAGSALSGVLSDRWLSRGVTAARLRLPLIWWIGVIPALLMLTLASNPLLALAGLFLFNLLNIIGYVSAFVVIQDMVPSTLRGRTTAFWYLITGIIGNGLGPLATGLATDHVFHDEAAIGSSILLVTIPVAVLGLIFSLAALKPYERARAALSGQAPLAKPESA